MPEQLGYNTNVKLAKPTHLAALANNLAHVRRNKAIAFEKDTLTTNQTAIRRWYARILEELALGPRNKPAPK